MITLVHDTGIDDLNKKIKLELEKGSIPYGIPFVKGDQLCQMMYDDDTLIKKKSIDFIYRIYPFEARPTELQRGVEFEFNCKPHVVWLHWPTAHLQANLPTILCLKGMFPV